MKVKEFFKSNAFKSLAVLLAIVLVAGFLLAILNDVFYISDEERLERAIAKVYGDGAEIKKTVELKDDQKKYDNGTVNSAYEMSDGNYFINVTGNNAYGGGTVTLWVVVEVKDGKLGGVGKVAMESNTVSKYYDVSNDFIKKYDTSDSDVAAGKYFKTSGSDGIVNITAGATASSEAFNNGVNTAIDFYKAVILGVDVATYKYEYEKFVDMENSTITPDLTAKTVTYALTMGKSSPAPAGAKFTIVVGEDKKISSFKLEESAYANPESFAENVDATLKDGTYFVGKALADITAVLNEDGKATLTGTSLTTGATRSSELFFRAAAFALANYETILYEKEYTDFVTDVQATVDGTNVTYVLTMGKSSPAPAGAKFTVTVGEDKKISAFTLEDSAYANPESFGDKVDATLKDGTYFVGKALADITGVLNEEGKATLTGTSLATGATRSTELFFRAAAYALANYDVTLAQGGTQA